MTANAFHNIAQIETSLWEAADQLRANYHFTATEYSMPVLGVIFCGTPPTVIKPRCKPLRLRRRLALAPSVRWSRGETPEASFFFKAARRRTGG